MQTLKKIKETLKSKNNRVLVRVDFNVPIEDDKIQDTFRIDKALPTIEFLVKQKAKVILIAHLGEDGTQSLAPVAKYLNKKIKTVFLPTTNLSDIEELVEKMVGGDVILLENIRRFPGEKENDTVLARSLSRMGDLYVNDAFSVSHRKHASIVGIAKHLPSFAGLQLEEEIKNLSKVLEPKHPFLFILGGAKFSTKLPLLKKYLESADSVFIGGALANNALKSAGFEVGTSLVDDGFEVPKNILKHKNFFLPMDVVVEENSASHTCTVAETTETEKIVDIGASTVKEILALSKSSKLVVWNGPLGFYEHGYDKATKELLKGLAKLEKTEVIIGGGDTVTLVQKMKLTDKFNFVSTGGGATLEFLSKGTLVGIDVLK